MKFLALIVSVVLFSFCEARAEDTPSTPPVPAATTPAPAQPAATPAAPAPVANKPDEDTEPGAFKRRLQAAAGLFTGDHASLSDLKAKDDEIAGLKARIAALEATNASQAKDALDVISSIAAGKPATTPAATAAVQAIQNATSEKIKAVGIPTESLTQPKAMEQAPASGQALTQAARNSAIREMWKNCGHEIPAPSSLN